MKLVDSHCHLDGNAFSKDRRDTIDRFKAIGGIAMMIAGIDEKSSKSAIRLADKHKSIYASVGIHPHDAGTCDKGTLSTLKELSRHPKVKAWGEIGLDFNRMYSPQKIQEEAFTNQLAAADELELPRMFHERDTNGRLIEILNAHSNK